MSSFGSFRSGDFSELHELLPQIFYEIDSELNVTFLNRRGLKATGYSLEDLGVGLNVLQLFNPADSLRLRGHIALMMKGELQEGNEYIVHCKDGSTFPVIAYSSPMFVEGRFVGIRGVAVDVTEQKHSEMELRAQSEKLAELLKRQSEKYGELEWDYRNIVESSPNAISVTLGGILVYVNPKRVELTGHKDKSELLGTLGLDALLPEDQEYIRERLRRRELGESVSDRVEFRLRKTDGGVVIVTDYNTEVIWEGRSSVMHIMVDITATEEYRKNLDTLLEHASQLTTCRSYREVAKATFTAVQQVLGFSWGSFAVVKGNVLRHIYISILPEETFDMPLDGSGITVRAVRTGKTQLIDDVWRDPDFVRGLDSELDVRSELVVPIRVEGRVLAVIDVESEKVGAFTVDHMQLVEVLAMHVSSAFINILEREQRQVYTLRLESLHRSSSLLAEAGTRDVVYDIVQGIMEHDFKYAWAGVGVVENDLIRYVRHMKELNEDPCVSLTGHSVTVRAVKTGLAQNVPDVRDDPDYLQLWKPQEPLLSELVVPVIVDGRVVLLLNIESTQLNEFSENDVKLMELLSLHAASALKSISSGEERQAYEKRLKAIAVTMASMNLCDSLEKIAEICLGIIEDVIASPVSAFLVVDGDDLVVAKMRGGELQGTRYPMSGVGVAAKAARENQVVVVEDTRLCPYYLDVVPWILSELAVPVSVGDVVVGVIIMGSPEVGYFNDNYVSLIMLLCGHAASNIERLWSMENERVAQRKVIEERARAEEARRLEEMKTRFIQTATHEIRTPLTSIKGYTELIQMMFDEGTSKELVQYFDVIMRNIDRLDKLTTELLEVQRIESGRLELNKSIFRFSMLYTQLSDELSPILAERDQRLDAAYGDIWVYGDRDRLQQVMVNLVVNASKFSPQGSVIKIHVERVDDKVLVKVIDVGVGISPDDMPKIFQPFPGILVNGVTNGIGLGLSICKGIVELHGGEIWVESEGAGKGSAFCFTLPLSSVIENDS